MDLGHPEPKRLRVDSSASASASASAPVAAPDPAAAPASASSSSTAAITAASFPHPAAPASAEYAWQSRTSAHDPDRTLPRPPPLMRPANEFDARSPYTPRSMSGPPPPPPNQHAPPHYIADARGPPLDYPPPTGQEQAYRHPSGTYAPYNGAPESPIKRDPSHEPLHPQYARPQSTGPSLNDLHRLNGPYDDYRRASVSGHESQTYPPAPPSYRPVPQYAPPLQVPTPQPVPMYEASPYTPIPAASSSSMRDSIYDGSTYGSSSALNANKKKAPRTAQACGQCRAAKAKCDDPKPCTACRKAGITCDFTPPEPKPADKLQSDLLAAVREGNDRMMRMERALGVVNRMERTLDVVSKIVFKDHPDMEPSMREEITQIAKIKDEVEAPPSPAAPRARPLYSTSSSYDGAAQVMYNDVDVADVPDEEDADDGIAPDNNPAIPENHTTHASRLLNWPAVQALIGDYIDKTRGLRNTRYTRRKELQRGSLRIYGRGEGSDKAVADDQDHGTFADDGNSDPSPSPTSEVLWGPLDPHRPADLTRHGDQFAGGLDGEGNLDLDASTVSKLATSYMNHMNIMHPIVLPSELNKLLEAFPKTFKVPAEKDKPGIVASFILQPSTQSTGSTNKRKRADDSLEYVPNKHPVNLGSSAVPMRGLNTAVVLVILALGKLCEWKGRLPTPVPESSDPNTGSNGYISSSQNSPVHPLVPTASPQQTHKSQLAKHDNYGLPQSMSKTNLDVVPGLAYLAAARVILADHEAATELRFAQAKILESLYWNQLCRVNQSHAALYLGGRTLHIKLFDNSKRFAKMTEDLKLGTKKDTQLIMLAWTHLQLESDILAELAFPPSNILSWEDVIPWPDLNHLLVDGVSSAVTLSYTKQLWMRKKLNEIHRSLYTPEAERSYVLPMEKGALSQLLAKIEYLAKDSEKMFNGDQLEHPDPHIHTLLRERLRAKIYGALVIAYRPCLMMALNRGSLPWKDVPSEVVANAGKCIECLIKSTEAFGCIKDRVIITNPWGTSHAQWGNVIVLQAAWMEPHLRDYISRDLLIQLIDKTVSFLEMYSLPSSALNLDIKILKYMAARTGLKPQTDMSSSFTSTVSSQSTPT